jgi:hypothetical protein
MRDPAFLERRVGRHRGVVWVIAGDRLAIGVVAIAGIRIVEIGRLLRTIFRNRESGEIRMLQRTVRARRPADRRDRDQRVGAGRARPADKRIGSVTERWHEGAVGRAGDVLVVIVGRCAVHVDLPVVARRRIAAPASERIPDLCVARGIAVRDAEDQRAEGMHVGGRIDADRDRCCTCRWGRGLGSAQWQRRSNERAQHHGRQRPYRNDLHEFPAMAVPRS